jgi:hypothetical protein
MTNGKETNLDHARRAILQARFRQIPIQFPPHQAHRIWKACENFRLLRPAERRQFHRLARNVRVVDDQLKFTTPITDVRGEGCLVGRYRIAIDLKTGKIAGRALDGQRTRYGHGRRAWHHPNLPWNYFCVFAPRSRRFCFGNYEGRVNEALDTGDIIALALLINDVLTNGPSDIDWSLHRPLTSTETGSTT